MIVVVVSGPPSTGVIVVLVSGPPSIGVMVVVVSGPPSTGVIVVVVVIVGASSWPGVGVGASSWAAAFGASSRRKARKNPARTKITVIDSSQMLVGANLFMI